MRAQRGLTLVELMIALVLSSIVVYAGISMFLASRGTASTTSAVGAVTDSGRVALDFIADSVRTSGAMQCNAVNNSSAPSGVSLTNNITNSAGLALNYAEAMDGFEAAGTGVGGTFTVAGTPIAADGAGTDWSTSAGAPLDALLTGRVVQGNDVVAVRESIPSSAPAYLPIGSSYATGTGQVTLTVANVQNLQPLQYAVISNCAYATVFQINNVDPVAETITTNGPLDSSADLGQSFVQGAVINAVDMTAYFIAPGRDTDSALYSYDEWTGQFAQLVPDVENMQVLYGIASGSPGQVGSYVTADHVPDFNSVVSVQVALLVASPPGVRAVAQPAVAQTYSLLGTTVTAPIDARMRRVFVTTIAVENAAD